MTQDETGQQEAREGSPVVTVICVTYRHEKYIAEALESFISQKTNFPYQVFVGEDCGKDGTAQIVKDYAQRYPDIIIPFIREKNMGSVPNLLDLCSRVKSPYVAFCDGDDFWTDEYKLQKQYDYMQGNPDVMLCFHNVKILADEDWYYNEYYNANENGEIIIPQGIPKFDSTKEKYSFDEYLLQHSVPGRFCSLFFRWDPPFEIPEWVWGCKWGDLPLTLLRIGLGSVGFITDVMAVYRRNETGIVMFGNRDEDFINTRPVWLYVLHYVRQYYIKNYNSYGLISIDSRIKQEMVNYLNTLCDVASADKVMEILKTYPEEFFLTFKMLNWHRNNDIQARSIGLDALVNSVAPHPFLKKAMKPFVKVGMAGVRTLQWMHGKYKVLNVMLKYWINSMKPKKKNLWVFTSFRNTGYLDNSKYLFEHVLAHHPEIKAVWLTRDHKVLNRLHAEGKPVLKISSREGKKALSRAAVAFSDHFRVKDYSPRFGFNNGTKIVQLWHGVGLKTMVGFKLTNIEGVRFSSDILARKGDGLPTRLIKKARYFHSAPFRELFERFLFLVCPGDDAKDEWRNCYHLREEQMFECGYPRVAAMVSASKPADPAAPRFLYAPTYRWSEDAEADMVKRLTDAFPKIQALMQHVNGTFVLRLHPHTWRNYNSRIWYRLKNMDRIRIDQEPDVYKDLGNYSMLISDYSSIAYDFLHLDRPIVFLCYDYDDFIKTENSLRHDYMEYSPGQKARSWDEAIRAIRGYLRDPAKDGEWRRRILNEFFYPEYNGPDNCERIVREVKSRLGLSLQANAGIGVKG